MFWNIYPTKKNVGIVCFSQTFRSTSHFRSFVMERAYQTYCRIIDYLCSACRMDWISWDYFSGWIYRNFCFSSEEVFNLSNCYFWLVTTHFRSDNVTGSAFSFPFTASSGAINPSRRVGCLIFSLFAVNVTLKSGTKKRDNECLI